MSDSLSPEDARMKKVLPAIMAGVAAYIEEQGRATPTVAQRPIDVAGARLWPMMGREEIMRMRMMWQRRMVRGMSQ